jgi:hypothetical protein
MGYKYLKRTGWTGYCDCCEKPFLPSLVFRTDMLKENKIFGDYGKTGRPILWRKFYRGCCAGCRGKEDASQRAAIWDAHERCVVVEIDGVDVV